MTTPETNAPAVIRIKFRLRDVDIATVRQRILARLLECDPDLHQTLGENAECLDEFIIRVRRVAKQAMLLGSYFYRQSCVDLLSNGLAQSYNERKDQYVAYCVCSVPNVAQDYRATVAARTGNVEAANTAPAT